MVRGWKSNAGWSFPRGKINSEEPEEACAIREVSSIPLAGQRRILELNVLLQVEEETGFDLSGLIKKQDSIQTQVNAQTITMFIVKDIDENTTFQTQTKKEIGVTTYPAQSHTS